MEQKQYKVKIVLPIGNPIEEVWGFDSKLSTNEIYDYILKKKYITLGDGMRIIRSNIVAIKIEEEK